MLRHVLLLQARAESTSENIAACREALAGLVSERRDRYRHGFSMDFADAASLAAYGPHPAHQRAAQLVRTHFSRVTVFDFEINR